MTRILLSLALLRSSLALAEGGAASNLVDQDLQDDTEIQVDVLQVGETIAWTGSGTLSIEDDTGAAVATLSSGQATAGLSVGTYTAFLSEDQEGVNWDISVSGATGGRVSSVEWYFNVGNYTDGFDGSFFALVPGGGTAHSTVIELRADGLAGYRWEIGANQLGVVGANGRSVDEDGNQFVPGLPIYLNPPERATYSTIAPTVVGSLYGADSAVDCDVVVPGALAGEFTFDANVEGTYHIVCDLDDDGVFDFTSGDDLHLLGDTVDGANTVPWDGLDNDGSPVPDGIYDCRVEITVGEFHYVAVDVETSYEGFALFEVDDLGGSTGLPMFWNDVEVQSAADPMANGALGLETSGPAGILSGWPASPNVNARSWGDNTSGSKGDDTFMDTYTYVASVTSGTLSVDVQDGTADADGDGLPDYVETCTHGTDPDLADTDGDGLDDDVEVAGPTDPLDPDTDGSGVPDGAEVALGGDPTDGGDDGGPSADAQVSRDGRPVVTGGYVPGALGGDDEDLRVTVDGVTIDLGDPRLTVDGAGTWTLDLSGTVLEDGTYDVAVIQCADTTPEVCATDTASDELVVDVLPDPAQVTVVVTETASLQPTLTGSYDPAQLDTLTVTVDGVTYTLGTDPALTVDGAGTWTLDLAAAGQTLAEAAHDVDVRQTDSEGNAANDASTGELVVDIPPDAARVTADAGTFDTPSPVLTGSYDPGQLDVLTVTVDGVTYTLGTDPALTVDGAGRWTLDLGAAGQSLDDGPHDVQVQQTDAQGTGVVDGTSGEVEIDTVAPEAPTVDGQLTDQASPVVTGSWDDDDAVAVVVTI
ncbi:MAG: hypothetical protein AAF211_21490, partial [Myxococcota bacterium]